MTQTPMTAKQIVDETVSYYSEDTSRRSFVTDEEGRDKCIYRTKDGRMCAVGRCLTDEAAKEFGQVMEDASGLAALANPGEYSESGLDPLLRPQYHGHSLEFWCELQRLHDWGRNWSDDGISPEGKSYADTIAKEWTNDTDMQDM